MFQGEKYKDEQLYEGKKKRKKERSRVRKEIKVTERKRKQDQFFMQEKVSPLDIS